MGFSTGKKLLVTKRNMRSGSGALSTWGTNLGWKLSTIFLNGKVFHDWSIIKLGNILYLLDGSIFAVPFGTTFHCLC